VFFRQCVRSDLFRFCCAGLGNELRLFVLYQDAIFGTCWPRERNPPANGRPLPLFGRAKIALSRVRDADIGFWLNPHHGQRSLLYLLVYRTFLRVHGICPSNDLLAWHVPVNVPDRIGLMSVGSRTRLSICACFRTICSYDQMLPQLETPCGYVNEQSLHNCD